MRVANSPPTAQQLIRRWLIGGVIGTLIIAITSPLFVRSYVPLQADPVRGVWTLEPRSTYRWRSEGYANTSIGPFGMPGRATFPNDNPAVLRVALWGDSQTEGCCVADAEKIFSQTMAIGLAEAFPVDALPLARSGEDAADWVTQIPAAEQSLDVAIHVLMIADLPDLIPAIDAPLPPPADDQVAQAKSALAKTLPAFVVQAARNLLTKQDGASRRQLRFSLGPTKTQTTAPQREPTASTASKLTDWQSALHAISQTATRPVVLVYAPVLPIIVDGNLVSTDPNSTDFERLKQVAQQQGMVVVDARDALLESAQQGDWPHGFHNGQFAVGHLNATGNRIVADAVIRGLKEASAMPPRDGN